jgi:hypothetical protein
MKQPRSPEEGLALMGPGVRDGAAKSTAERSADDDVPRHTLHTRRAIFPAWKSVGYHRATTPSLGQRGHIKTMYPFWRRTSDRARRFLRTGRPAKKARYRQIARKRSSEAVLPHSA